MYSLSLFGIHFETLGGKVKSRNWRRSIMQENVQLGVFLSSVGIQSSSPTPGSSLLLSGPSDTRLSCHLVDTALAYIKAYRLKGDAVGLKQAVLSTFDSSALAAAYKSLWDICCVDLKDCGLTFHQRRTSEKRPAADAFLTDIITAFDKLDTADKLPAIFCEANELIRLPSLVIDTV